MQAVHEFAAPVTPDVARVLIDAAPQPGMLRHSDEQRAAGSHGGVKGDEGARVIADMFEDIEGADDVELSGEIERARVLVEERGGWHPQLSHGQAAIHEVTGRELQVGECRLDGLEHEARAAADVQQRCRIRAVPVDRPDDETVAGFEPVIAGLRLSETCEGLLREAAAWWPLRLKGHGVSVTWCPRDSTRQCRAQATKQVLSFDLSLHVIAQQRYSKTTIFLLDKPLSDGPESAVHFVNAYRSRSEHPSSK